WWISPSTPASTCPASAACPEAGESWWQGLVRCLTLPHPSRLAPWPEKAIPGNMMYPDANGLPSGCGMKIPLAAFLEREPMAVWAMPARSCGEEAEDGRPEIRHPEQARRLDAERAAGPRAPLRLSAAPRRAAEMAAALLPAVEPAVAGLGPGLVGLDRAGEIRDGQPALGLGPLAFRRQRGGGLPVLRRDGTASLHPPRA